MGQYDRKAQSQPKHGKPSSSGASKAAAPPPVHRPEWKGPGYVKKPAARTQSKTATETTLQTQDQLLSIDAQQRMLNVFRSALPVCDEFDALKPLLHQVHQACTRRDWDEAFKDDERRQAYSLRWPPSRSLLYTNVLADISTQYSEVNRFNVSRDESTVAKFICLGASPAAMMGLAGFLQTVTSATNGRTGEKGTAEQQSLTDECLMDIALVDSTDWSSVVGRLQDALITAPSLSKYASAAAIEANAAFLPSSALRTTCHARGILDLDRGKAETLLGHGRVAVCFFHTLANLLATSLTETTALLRLIESVMQPGGLIFMIDSADATVPVGASDGKAAQACPLDWIVGRILLGATQSGADDQQQAIEPTWDRLVHEQYRIHRLDKKLTYPAGLENLKCQYHVYRRR